MPQYNVNPIQLIQMIKSGKNPQQLLMGILQNQAHIRALRPLINETPGKIGIIEPTTNMAGVGSIFN